MKKKKQPAKKTTSSASKKNRPPRRPPVPPEISAERQRTAWQLRLVHGMTYAEITKKLNEMFPEEYQLKSDHQAVEKMIKKMEQEYIKEHQAEVDRIKAEAGASLDFVRREAADAWQKSQDWLKVITKRENQTIEQILKAQTGDAAYLKVIKDAAIEKAKLFGAVAPIKHNVKHGGKVEVTPQMSPEEIAQRVSTLLSIAEERRKKHADSNSD